MSNSSRKRGPAWSRRNTSAIRAGVPGSLNVAFDIVRPSIHSRAKAPLSGSSATTRAPTPAVAAARVLNSSFARSTASRSVEAPGNRTKNGLPSTSTRWFWLVSPAVMGET